MIATTNRNDPVMGGVVMTEDGHHPIDNDNRHILHDSTVGEINHSSCGNNREPSPPQPQQLVVPGRSSGGCTADATAIPPNGNQKNKNNKGIVGIENDDGNEVPNTRPRLILRRHEQNQQAPKKNEKPIVAPTDVGIVEERGSSTATTTAMIFTAVPQQQIHYQSSSKQLQRRRRQVRLLQSGIQSILQSIRATTYTSSSSTYSKSPLVSLQSQFPNSTSGSSATATSNTASSVGTTSSSSGQWYQTNRDIVALTIPLFPSPVTTATTISGQSDHHHHHSNINSSSSTGSMMTAVQRLYIDLHEQYHQLRNIRIETPTSSSSCKNSDDEMLYHFHQFIASSCHGIITPDINAVITNAILSTIYNLFVDNGMDDCATTTHSNDCTFVSMLLRQHENNINNNDFNQILHAMMNCRFVEATAVVDLLNSNHHSYSQRNHNDSQHNSSSQRSIVATRIVADHSNREKNFVDTCHHQPPPPQQSRRRASTMSIPDKVPPIQQQSSQPPSVRQLPPRQSTSSFYESKAISTTFMNDATQIAADEIVVNTLLQLSLFMIQKVMPHHRDEKKEHQHHPQYMIGLLDICWKVYCKTPAVTTASCILRQMAMDSELQMIRSIVSQQNHQQQSTSAIEVVLDHVLERVSNYLLIMVQPSANIVSTMTHVQDGAGVGGFKSHNYYSLTSVMHCLSVIKVIAGLMDNDATSKSIVDALQGPVVRSVITVAIHTTNSAVLHNCIEIVNELLSMYGLVSLKCEFEIFLHAAIIRRLVMVETIGKKSVSMEEKEVVLEYLQDICFVAHNSASLSSLGMLDLYVNYDCDCKCTNVFETLLSVLSKLARPTNWDTSDTHMTVATVLSTVGSGESDATTDSERHFAVNDEVSSPHIKATSVENMTSGNNTPMSHLNRLAINCILSTLEMTEQIAIPMNRVNTAGFSCTGVESNDEMMIQRKKNEKLALDRVVGVFNTTNPDKGEWLNLAIKEGVIETMDNASSVAKLLFMVPLNIDKQRVGIYLSRGPEADFPFHASVRTHFVTMFDFRNMSFPISLRKFLSKFRLPGEAQCIDRLMETFSKEYFEQHKESTIFLNSDAVYVLAFSTIMLNTDLHNPTIKADQRMTLDQFLKNNRGINAGEDLPSGYLSDLYDQIKERELQLLTEMDQFMSTHGGGTTEPKINWDEICGDRHEMGAPIRLSEESRQNGCTTLSHALLTVSVSSYGPPLLGTFLTSTDDAMVFRMLQAIQRVLKLATSAEIGSFINEILQIFLSIGKDYISKHISEEAAASSSIPMQPVDTTSRRKRNNSIDSVIMSEDILLGIEKSQIPYGMLSSRTQDDEIDDVAGCAEHRGLLALDSCFVFMASHSTITVNGVWPALVTCLCMLRDSHALPNSVSDLDDFADSNGNVLPLSSFAVASQKRLQDYHRVMNDKENPKQKGWFRSLFRKSKIDDPTSIADGTIIPVPATEQSIYVKALRGISESSNIECIVQMGSSRIPDESIGILLEILNKYPFDNDPVGEQHSVFTVELAARALLSHPERAEELFVMFLSRFEHILCKATNVDGDIPDAPFVIERIVVTILRCCIHLYEYPTIRPHLRTSLQLLTMTLPRSFIHVIADRISCGLAIILRASFPYFESQQEWSFMNDMLDALAHYESSRVFVFDGIASTVEYAMPNFDPNKHMIVPVLTESLPSLMGPTSEEMMDTDVRPPPPPPPQTLSIEACGVLSRILTRFVLNYYHHGDESLMVPAMLCLEKVYRRKVDILLLLQQQKQHLPQPQHPTNDSSINDDDHSQTSPPERDVVTDTTVPDPELWQNVVVAIYAVCRNSNPDASTMATQCFRRIVIDTHVHDIPSTTWITILYLMVHKQPPMMIQSQISRANTFTILGQLVVHVIPSILFVRRNTDNQHREDLEEFVLQLTALAEENIQSSSSSSNNKILLDTTVQTVTYMCHHILSTADVADDSSSDKLCCDRELCVWMNETLLSPLEMASTIMLMQQQQQQSSTRTSSSSPAVPNNNRSTTTNVVVTTFDNHDELDDVSEISDSVAGDDY